MCTLALARREGKGPVGAKVFSAERLHRLTSSLGEARRLLKAGGLYMNSVRVTPSSTGEVLVLDEDLIDGEVVLLRAGKKKHALIDVTK